MPGSSAIGNTGRKKHPEWDEVMDAEGNNRVQCSHCFATFSKKIERVRKHLADCEVRKEAMRENFAQNGNDMYEAVSENMPEEVKEIIRGVVQSESSEANIHPAQKRQKLMDSYTISTPKNVKDDLDLKIAKFFFSANIPFNAADNREFKNMIASLRPGYEPPSRKCIAGNLLDKIHEEVSLEINSGLTKELKVLTLMQDGWSNSSNDPILAHSVHDGEHTTLLSVVDCKAKKNCRILF